MSPHDALIQRHIEQQLRPWQQYRLDEGDELLTDPLDEMQEAYMRLIGERYCWRREQNKRARLRVTYTAMHGVGAPWAAKAFESVAVIHTCSAWRRYSMTGRTNQSAV